MSEALNKYAEIVELANELDQKGLTEEANKLDEVLQKIAAKDAEERQMRGGTAKAMGSLLRALESFNKKNLSSNGHKRKQHHEILNMAEDLEDLIREFLGEKK